MVGVGLSVSAMATTITEIPLPKEYKNTFVSDVANVISSEKEKQLDGMLIDHYNQTGNQVAVVTTPDTKGEGSPKMFAVELFNEWGLGDADKDNGLLLLLSIEDRKIVFETGYGLEGIIPDVVQFRVQKEHMVPPFKVGDYETGLLAGTDAILQKINEGMQEELAYQSSLSQKQTAMESGASAPDLRQGIDEFKGDIESTAATVFYFILIFFGLPLLIIASFTALITFRGNTGDYKKADEDKRIMLSCVQCGCINKHTEAVLESRVKKLHTTPLEAAFARLNLAVLKFYQCEVCHSTNKMLIKSRRIDHCGECNQTAKFKFLVCRINLANFINTYRDKNDRTKDFSNNKFIKLNEQWKEKSSVELIVNWCIVCNKVADQRKIMSVSVDRSVKRASSDTKGNSWNDVDDGLLIGSSYSSSSRRSSSSSYDAGSNIGLGSGSGFSSPSDTSSSIGFGGGDSGGGGASSSF